MDLQHGRPGLAALAVDPDHGAGLRVELMRQLGTLLQHLVVLADEVRTNLHRGDGSGVRSRHCRTDTGVTESQSSPASNRSIKTTKKNIKNKKGGREGGVKSSSSSSEARPDDQIEPGEGGDSREAKTLKISERERRERKREQLAES